MDRVERKAGLVFQNAKACVRISKSTWWRYKEVGEEGRKGKKRTKAIIAPAWR
jgi:hypothetical protein